MKLIKRLLTIFAVLAIICGVVYVLNEKYKSKYITVTDDKDSAAF